MSELLSSKNLCAFASPRGGFRGVDWRVSQGLVDYAQAVAEMEVMAAASAAGSAPVSVWLLEHPPVYTAGTSARAADLLQPRFPVIETGRGGQYTYHGPGQRVAYVVADLRQRGAPDLRGYICDLEAWLIRALEILGVQGERREGRVGIWVDLAPYGRRGEAKIAAIGVRVRRWVAYHGVSLNVNPDLSHFSGIVPCGIADHGVTSLADLGVAATMQEGDAALKSAWRDVFGDAERAP